MFERPQALLNELAKSIGVDSLQPGANGGVQLALGDNASAVLFAEDESTLLIVAPVMELPAAIDYGRVLWLLRRNFYDSPLMPFRVSCDTAGHIVVWGRVPVDSMTGETLASLLDALAAETEFIREEVEVDDSPES